ncbi:MAG TPA: SDR family oxidoreductase [Propionibacteriaceae bacterium]|nr:SDR family oxidoreductase [Propionibacteriaceae bacterium]
MSHALITGASLGLGRALAFELARRGWSLTIDARHEEPLAGTAQALSELTSVRAIPGDISNADHREQLVAVVAAAGRLSLVINNASDLGGSPLPRLRDLEATAYERLLHTNVVAPQQLIRALLPYLGPQAVIINVSSDAGVDHYESWGGYGSSKAALDHQTVTWAVEEPDFTWYSLDPGDMRTAMHQAAYPDEDISDRPEPEAVAPIVVALISSGLPSGRYRTAELAASLSEIVRS